MLEFYYFLLGKKIELAVGLHCIDLVQSCHSAPDRLEVREHSAQPSVADIVHAAALGFGLYRILSLLLCSDKKNSLIIHRYITDEIIRFFYLFDCLLKIDDVNPVSFREDELLHFGIPSAGLMSEMNTGFQELLH